MHDGRRSPGQPFEGGDDVGLLANRTLHLQLDQPVHLDRVLHRQLLDDRLDEAVDDQLRGLLLGDAVGHQVEELLVSDLRDGRLVADVDVVLADPDRRVGVRARVLVEQQRVADDLGPRAVRRPWRPRAGRDRSRARRPWRSTWRRCSRSCSARRG